MHAGCVGVLLVATAAAGASAAASAAAIPVAFAPSVVTTQHICLGDRSSTPAKAFSCGGFARRPLTRIRRSSSFSRAMAEDDDGDDDNSGGCEWTSLVDSSSSSSPPSPGAVRKRIIQAGSSSSGSDDDEQLPTPGSTITIDYVGMLLPSGGGISQWSPRDVVECWLNTRQGAPDGLGAKFLEVGVDGHTLTDGTFTDDYMRDVLGVENRMAIKKLTVAARRLAEQVREYSSEDEVEFDSSKQRGPYSFTLGKGNAIKAMELAASTMKRGEKAEVICRADYAYGPEGLRRGDGTVVVPPYATLRFVITVLEC